MNVNLEYYRIFYHVSKNLSFSKGAAELYMTQSAVSQSIKNLEKALSLKLFNRTAKNVTLTLEGKTLYEYVKSALSLIEKGESEITKMQALEQGDLRIGVGDTISRYLLLPYLDSFNKSHPNIRLQIINRTSKDEISLLKDGKIDLCIINLPIKDGSILITPFIEISDIFVASNHFKHLKGKTLTPEELCKLPLILLEQISNSRKYVDSFFEKQGCNLLPEIELGSHDLMLDFAKINLGISCVVEEFASTHLKSGELFKIELSPKIPPRGIGICTLKGVTPSAPCTAFLNLLIPKVSNPL